jgi:hypothetical protein
MNFIQKYVILAVMLMVGISPANAATDDTDYISLLVNDKWIQVDLNDDAQREGFITRFGKLAGLAVCFNKADYTTAYMEERDAGVLLATHIGEVRAQYEQTKLDPQGAVPWHVYIDFERLVRDVHRLNGRNAKSKYRYTDPKELWNREFKWCAIG